MKAAHSTRRSLIRAGLLGIPSLAAAADLKEPGSDQDPIRPGLRLSRWILAGEFGTLRLHSRDLSCPRGAVDAHCHVFGTRQYLPQPLLVCLEDTAQRLLVGGLVARLSTRTLRCSRFLEYRIRLIGAAVGEDVVGDGRWDIRYTYSTFPTLKRDEITSGTTIAARLFVSPGSVP